MSLPIMLDSVKSKGAGQTVLIAAINAALSQGIFGRSFTDQGTMSERDDDAPGNPEFVGRFAFEHAGVSFEARVKTYYQGAELSILVWAPSSQSTGICEANAGSRLNHGFDLVAHGWVERKNGFYLHDPSGHPHVQVSRSLRALLKANPVVSSGFRVRPRLEGLGR